ENPPIIKPTETEIEQPEEEEEGQPENSNDQHISTSSNSHIENTLPHSHINTGHTCGMNGQLTLTRKQAETLAAQQLWDNFKQKFTQNNFSEENGENENQLLPDTKL